MEGISRSENQESHESLLDAFHDEITKLKTQEAEDGKTAHFERMDASNLTEQDRAVWEKFNAGKFSNQDLINWRNDINADFKHRSDSDWLAQYIANKLNAELDVEAYMREQEERKKKLWG